MHIIKLSPGRNENHASNRKSVVVGPISVNSSIRVDSSRDRNPGIGGSEYHSIQIALVLAEAGASVYMEFDNEVPAISGASPVETLPDDVQLRISTVQGVLAGTPNSSRRWIVVSHHPHDGGLRQVKEMLGEKLLAVVNVGRYQFFSNRVTKNLNLWLPAFGNLDPNPPIRSVSLSTMHRQAVGHISSLHKSKGFHIALDGWIRFAKSNPRSLFTFRVVGSSDLYKKTLFSRSHSIPIAGSYGEKIHATLMRTPFVAKSVIFLGLITGDVFEEMSQWAVALQNPLGIAEADPVVVQDCFVNQVPVIGGSLFGMYDYMRFFPELQAHTSAGVAKKLAHFLEDREMQHRVLLRLRGIETDLRNRRALTESLWVELALKCDKKMMSGIDPGKPELKLKWRLILGAAIEFGFRLNNRLSSAATRFLRSSA